MEVANVENQHAKVNAYKTFSGSERINKLACKSLSGSELATKHICKTSSGKRVDTQEIMKSETEYMTTTGTDVTKTLPVALNANITIKDTVDIDRQHQHYWHVNIGKEASCKLLTTDNEQMYTIYYGAELVQEPTTTSYSPVKNLSDKTCSGNVALKKAIERQLSASIVSVFSSNEDTKKTICRTLSADDAKQSYRTAQIPTPTNCRIL